MINSIKTKIVAMTCSLSRLSTSRLLLLIFLAIMIWAMPVWLVPGMTGASDWDFFMNRCEAIRRTILEFHQWPGNNPWIGGGVPLAGNPCINVLSIQGLLTLSLGSFWGLRMAVLVYYFLGFIGAWKLSGLWWQYRAVRLVFVVFTIANPAVAFHMSLGHSLFQTFWCMPLLFYFLLRFKQDNWSGLKAAVIFGIAFNETPAYVLQYGMLIVCGLFLYFLVKDFRAHCKPLLRWLLLFVPLSAALTFFRAIMISHIAVDFPRIANYRMHFDFFQFFKFYLYPYINVAKIAEVPVCNTSGCLASYLGIIALALFLLSSWLSLKWWHVITFLLLWAASGNDSPFHLMRWIQEIPTYSAHMCFTRVRMFTPFFLGIGATWGLNYLWGKYRNYRLKYVRYLVVAIGIFMVAEVVVVSHLILRQSHVKLPFWSHDAPKTKFQQISGLPPFPNDSPWVCHTYRSIRMNQGWLRGYVDSYIPDASIVKGKDEVGYIAEYHQNGKPVEPIYWSPNHIRLEGLDPATPLFVNLNPGRPWYNNGQPLFPHDRIVEMQKRFVVWPDKKGVVDLTYRYPGVAVGIQGTFILLGLSVIIVVLLRRKLLIV